jgi:mono/diheme cytochrome c family protein
METRAMRRTRFALVTVALIAAIPALLVVACAPKAPEKPAATAVDAVARGRYLVTTMSCVDCHTPGTFYGAPDTTRALSGSDLGWVGPWGVVHARNLTPDSTGIGSWTEDDIVNTLRTGTTPYKMQLAPIMPWMNYGGLSDDDAHAIAKYLKSLPPIHHVNLDRIPPGGKIVGANMVFPPPPAWDAPPGPPPTGK